MKRRARARARTHTHTHTQNQGSVPAKVAESDLFFCLQDSEEKNIGSPEFLKYDTFNYFRKYNFVLLLRL